MKKHVSLFLFFVLTNSALSMDYTSVRLVLWKKGEAIYGEEFLAANESVIDYIGTLPRPDSGLKYFKYNCKAKIRGIRPQLNGTTSPATNSLWIDIFSVYDLKDCVQAD